MLVIIGYLVIYFVVVKIAKEMTNKVIGTRRD